MSVTYLPRSVRPAPQPLGLYFRAGQNDHTVLGSLLAQGRRSFHGIVFEARRIPRHRELLKDAERFRLECILDPGTQASATIGGYSAKDAQLPWGSKAPARPDDFRGTAGTSRLAALARFAVEHRFSQVFAPTHYFRNAEDGWFALDVENTARFRIALDRAGGKNIEIIYSLCTNYACFRDEDERGSVIENLNELPIRSVWLRIDGCGSDSTAAAVRNYALACEDMARLDLPLIGDQIGGLPGLSLLSLSAIGGLSTGLGIGERFDAGHWHRERKGRPYSPHAGVYLRSVDLSLAVDDARELFEHNARLKGQFGCSDASCCPRGITDMLERPSQHFVTQRMQQVSELSQQPESVRAAIFLERHIRPMTDRVLQLSKATGVDDSLRKRFAVHRKRMDAIRMAFTKLVESNQNVKHARLPQTRAMREHPPALR